ncbi:G5 domain-containing protein [Actinopolymorpha singaporensis]|uniref:G5 domain-containing protein n=2 Tax=Actinopolymorpha singaporensis TaxID=117157 RepID=A0A1H1QZS5_9ACTN|nr:G5 domain-containing protein [Actinopolymorpha singaporensis]
MDSSRPAGVTVPNASGNNGRAIAFFFARSCLQKSTSQLNLGSVKQRLNHDERGICMERVKTLGNCGRRPRLGHVVALTALLFLCGGTAACGAEQKNDAVSSATPSNTATPSHTPSQTPSQTPTPTSTPSPAALTQGTPSPTPTTVYRVVRTTETIPYESRTVNSAALKKGTIRLKQNGRNGLRTKVFRIAVRGGVEVGRTLVNTTVREPVTQVTLRGTRVPRPAPQPKSACDPNYTGACVPIASDVDCGGGSGNGPAYVYGTVKVVGTDIYDLDRDGDGYGCD